MSQIPLPLEPRTGGGSDVFYLGEANREAAVRLEQWPDWPDRAIVLLGPEASGKTHLLRLTRARLGGALAIFDDADRTPRDELAMFHGWNRARAGGDPLVFAARTPPGAWNIELPDLASRLKALPILTIGPPDDLLAAELLARHLRERGVRAAPEVTQYLVLRLERSYVALRDAAVRIDDAALERQRAVTVPFVRDVLFGEDEGS